MIPDYKGYKIDVTADGRFTATDSEGKEEASDHSLALLKQKLDFLSKKSIRRRVWIKQYEKLLPGNLTSVKKTGSIYSTSYYARVSFDAGSWGEENPNYVFEMNPENDQLAQEYIALRNHINELEKSASEIIRKMKHINIEELLK